MDGKEFFKPTKGKIILFFILLIISITLMVVETICTVAVDPDVTPACFDSYDLNYGGTPTVLCGPFLISFIFIPLVILLFGKICNYAILIGINALYLYTITCLIVLTYNKFKNK